MIEIIIEISLYLILAIVLGFVFGWFISKANWKSKYRREIKEFKELYLKKEKVLTRQVYSKEDNFIKTKDDLIEKLTVQLSLEEKKLIHLKREHEQEISAFVFERTDITQKYQELLFKIEEIKESQRLSKARY